jgi:hypothetical protein
LDPALNEIASQGALGAARAKKASFRLVRERKNDW